jgi:hypothetical protein
MTYEAATSLSIFLSSVAQSKKPSAMISLIRNGLGISPDSILFTLTPSVQNMEVSASTDQLDMLQGDAGFRVILDGDIIAVRSISLDLSMWRLGGAALPLRLIQLANVSTYSCFSTEYLPGTTDPSRAVAYSRHISRRPTQRLAEFGRHGANS